MSYHPKDVADFGTQHGYDLSSAKDVKELAAEYARSGKAPSGLAANTIEWHLEHFLKGEAVGLYEPDGTTRTTTERNTTVEHAPMCTGIHAPGEPCSR